MPPAITAKLNRMLIQKATIGRMCKVRASNITEGYCLKSFSSSPAASREACASSPEVPWSATSPPWGRGAGVFWAFFGGPEAFSWAKLAGSAQRSKIAAKARVSRARTARRFAIELVIASTRHRRFGDFRRPQDDANNVARQALRFRLQSRLGLLLLVLERGLGFLDSRPRLFPRLIHQRRSSLERLLPAGLLRLENRHPRLPQALFVTCCLVLRVGNVGVGLFDGALGACMAFFEDVLEGVMNQETVGNEQDQEKDNGRDRPEQ